MMIGPYCYKSFMVMQRKAGLRPTVEYGTIYHNY